MISSYFYGYLRQNDQLCPLLSVLELMKYATTLKLGNKLTAKAKTFLVSLLIQWHGFNHFQNFQLEFY